MADSDELLAWAAPHTWIPKVTDWLRPWLRPQALRELNAASSASSYVDDPAWLELLSPFLRNDLERVQAEIADKLASTALKVFHGCRTADAGEYFRNGLQAHDRDVLTERVRSIAVENLGWTPSRVEQRINEINNTIDLGRCYVILDDRAMLDYAPHYLIYGSEWIAAILGEGSRQVLLNVGVPTMLELKLPLNSVSPDQRHALLRALLLEWTRQIVEKPRNVAMRDFTFSLCWSPPPEWVIGHHHPKELRDPWDQYRLYRSPRTYCEYCRSAPSGSA